MTIDTSEQEFEATIERVLTGDRKHIEGVGERPVPYSAFTPGGYQKRTAADYDRERCLLPDDIVDFILATQPKTWKRLKEHYGAQTRPRFLRRLARAVEKRGTLDVLRRGVKDHGCHFDLVYNRPTTGLNPELQEKYRANRFAVVRQLPYSPKTEHTLDLVLCLNGLPLFTAELKNPLKGQSVEDAMEQYRADRDPREPFFRFGRCLAHFAVDTEEVYMSTRLEGRGTTFLPFNKGHDEGAGNPPVREGFGTRYLWRRIWSPDSALNLIQHYIHEIDVQDDDGRRTGDTALIFPRYHQLRAVRRLCRARARARTGGAVPGPALGRQWQEHLDCAPGPPTRVPARRGRHPRLRHGGGRDGPPRPRSPDRRGHPPVRADARRRGQRDAGER